MSKLDEVLSLHETTEAIERARRRRVKAELDRLLSGDPDKDHNECDHDRGWWPCLSVLAMDVQR